MLDKVLNLFYDIYSSDKEAQNKGRRLAEKAIHLNLDKSLIGACYLHEVLDKNYDSYFETLEIIKDIDEDIAKLVDKITKKQKETWGQYYYRISIIPEASQIVWLIMLQKLENVSKEDLNTILPYMSRIFDGIHKHIS